MPNVIEQEIGNIVSDILKDYKKERSIDKMDLFDQPQKRIVIEIVHKLLKIIYPGYFRDGSYKFYNFCSTNRRYDVLFK